MGKNSRKRKLRYQDRVAATKPGPPPALEAVLPTVEPPASTQADTVHSAVVMEQEASKVEPAKATTPVKKATAKAPAPAKTGPTSMAIDFKEIAEAGQGPERDSWESFAAELLEALGYEIRTPPARGPDGGQDILAIQTLRDRSGVERINWLVSCKHKAHSGRAVGVGDEDQVIERLHQHNAEGFLAVYSTVPSQAWVDRLAAICTRDNKRFRVLEPRSIERHLTTDPTTRTLFKRFFPESYARWMRDSKTPSGLWDDYEPLLCEACGHDVLTTTPIEPMTGVISRRDVTRNALIAILCDDIFAKRASGVYVSCKGECDQKLEKRHGKHNVNFWDMDELCEPDGFLRHWCQSLLHRYRLPATAARKLAGYMLCIAQYVVREPPLASEFFPRTPSMERLLSHVFPDAASSDLCGEEADADDDAP